MTHSSIWLIPSHGDSPHRGPPSLSPNTPYSPLVPVAHSSMWLIAQCASLLLVAHSSLWPTRPCGPLLHVAHCSMCFTPPCGPLLPVDNSSLCPSQPCGPLLPSLSCYSATIWHLCYNYHDNDLNNIQIMHAY